MSEYQELLTKYKNESTHPNNDGWTQKFYKEEYEKLKKIGEKKFEQVQLKKINDDIESDIAKLNKELNIFRQLLKNL